MDDAMDLEPASTSSVGAETDLIDFATALSLRNSTRPNAADLRVVLKSHGASEEIAELLNSPDVKFIPLRRKRGFTLYACKDCGKMHDQRKACDGFSKDIWARSLERTGWEAAVNAWVSDIAYLMLTLISHELDLC
jgi:hypothetical protein